MQTLELALEALGSDAPDVRQLEYQLQLAYTLRTELQIKRAVDRHDIQVAMESIGLELGPHYPAAAFTVLPSTTHYDVAMEGLGRVILELTTKLIRRIFELISDLIRQVTERGESYNVAAVAGKLQELRRLATLRYDWKQLVADASKAPTDELQSLGARLQRLLDQYDLMDKLAQDALSEGKITAHIRHFDADVGPWLQVIVGQVNELLAALDRDTPIDPVLQHRDEVYIRKFQMVMDLIDDSQGVDGRNVQLESMIAIVLNGNTKINAPLYVSAPAMLANMAKLKAVTHDVEVAIRKAEDRQAAVIREQLGQIATDLNRIKRYMSHVRKIHELRVRWIDSFVTIYTLAAQIRKQLQWTA